jgi:hypothetical protein
VTESVGQSPLASWLEGTKKRVKATWAEFAAQAGVSVDVLRRVRAGHIPVIETTRRMLAGTSTDAATADRLLASVVSRRGERRIRRGSQAQCRVCREWEPVCLVRSRRTFTPPDGLKPASFVHRDCAGQPGKVTLICPEDGCGKTRRVYWSAKRTRAHSKQRRRDGNYAVLCRPHNLSKQGRRQAGRMRSELFRSFERRLKRSQYARRVSARGIWEGAKVGDPQAKRIRAAVLGDRRQLGVLSPTRGPSIARGQLFKRWARVASHSPSTRGGFRLCQLCWKLVHGRKYHTGPGLCWDTWRRTSNYNDERERRRWSKEKLGPHPIDPPIPRFVGHLPQPGKIAQKFGWFAQNLAGLPQKRLAQEAGVSRPAVTTGIEDFKGWLPGDWSLVFARKAAVAILQERFPLPEGVRKRPDPGDRHRVRWLAGWGMGDEAIRRLLGYSIGEVNGILTSPLLFGPGGRLVRLSRMDRESTWHPEAWTGSIWESAEIPLRAILHEGLPASLEAARR